MRISASGGAHGTEDRLKNGGAIHSPRRSMLGSTTAPMAETVPVRRSIKKCLGFEISHIKEENTLFKQ